MTDPNEAETRRAAGARLEDGIRRIAAAEAADDEARAAAGKTGEELADATDQLYSNVLHFLQATTSTRAGKKAAGKAALSFARSVGVFEL